MPLTLISTDYSRNLSYYILEFSVIIVRPYKGYSNNGVSYKIELYSSYYIVYIAKNYKCDYIISYYKWEKIV